MLTSVLHMYTCTHLHVNTHTPYTEEEEEKQLMALEKRPQLTSVSLHTPFFFLEMFLAPWPTRGQFSS